MTKYKGLPHLNILLKFKDLGFEPSRDLSSIVYRFHRLELVYFALELIYRNELWQGYKNFCKRICPFDNGITFISLLANKFKKEGTLLADHHVVCMQTGLEILKYLFSLPNDENPIDYDTLKDGGKLKAADIFELVLRINERITNSEYNISPEDSVEDIFANAATSMVENCDFSNYNLAVMPLLYMYKSSLFIEFCQKDNELSKYLPELFSTYRCQDAKSYLHILAQIYCESHKGEYGYSRLIFSDEAPAPELFNKISCRIDELITEKNNRDYTAFRSKPIIRLSKNEYVVICVPFLINKIYNSFVFDLSRISGDGQHIRQIISTRFSESTLLFPLIKSIIEPRSPLHLSGEDCDKICETRSPDYYIRNWNDIFLIELKDYSFRADIKEDPSHDKIHQYIEEQFVSKSNGRDGAIKQLAHNVKAILDRNFVWDKSIQKPKNVYPILVVGNSLYATYGMTYILNEKFNQELQRKGISSSVVNPLIVIDIDTLILYQDFFVRKHSSFKKEIREYLKFIKKDFHTSKNIDLKVCSFMMPFPAYLNMKYNMDSIHLANKTKELDIWKN